MTADPDARPLGLVVAMDAELRHLLNAAPSVRERRDGIWLDRHLVVEGVPIVAVRCGIGLITAAAATERLINAHQPGAILNFGCAGAHRRDIMPGDLVIGERVVHHSAVRILASGEEHYAGFGYEVGGEKVDAAEVACHPALVEAARRAAADYAPAPWPPALGWPEVIPYRTPTIHVGAVASADVWTQAHARLDILHGRHASLCEDMEAAAIAQVCALHGVPFLTIKDISNNEYHHATDITGELSDFPVAEAGARAAAFTLRVIAFLPGRLA